MIFSLHYCLYIGSLQPNIGGNKKLNDVLCGLSECLWGTLKPLRAFSILELAVFRLTALIRVDIFRTWIRSSYRLSAPILANLVVSFSFTVTLKLGLSTTHGPFLCLDGYSTLLSRALVYFIVSSVFGIILPCTLVCLIYAYKISYLKNTGNGTVKSWFGANSRKRVTEIYGSLDNINDDVVVIENRNQRKLARQVLVMNAFLIASLLSFILTNAANIFEQFNDYRNSLRFSLRLLTIFFQALVPVASIAGHTRMMFLVRKFRLKNLIQNNRVVPSVVVVAINVASTPVVVDENRNK